MSAGAARAAFTLSVSCFCFLFLIFVLRPPPPLNVILILDWRFPGSGLLFLRRLRVKLIAGPACPGQSVRQSSLLWDLRQSPAWQRGLVHRSGLTPVTPVPGTDLTERSADRNIIRISHGDHLVLQRPSWPWQSDHMLGRSEVSRPPSKPRRWRQVAPGLRKSVMERSGWRVVRYGVVIVTRPGGAGEVLYGDPGVAGVGDLAEVGRLGQPRSVLSLN